MEQRKKNKRLSPRFVTDATITCSHFTTNFPSEHANHTVDGRISNFSEGGFYVETLDGFPVGTILMVRVLGVAMSTPGEPKGKKPRSICLAEVKWNRKLRSGNTAWKGMGLRCLE